MQNRKLKQTSDERNIENHCYMKQIGVQDRIWQVRDFLVSHIVLMLLYWLAIHVSLHRLSDAQSCVGWDCVSLSDTLPARPSVYMLLKNVFKMI